MTWINWAKFGGLMFGVMLVCYVLLPWIFRKLLAWWFSRRILQIVGAVVFLYYGFYMVVILVGGYVGGLLFW
jgi:hypothetical protein